MKPAGSYMGLAIRCPYCDEVPPVALGYGARKWRWMSVHIADAHGGGALRKRG